VIAGFFGEHRWLSNFWPAPVRWGVLCPTVEHAYQAAKSATPEGRAYIAASPTPAVAKRRGRLVTKRPDWGEVRVRVMHHLLRQKFVRGSVLATRLLETGDTQLVEANDWGDRFWGVCEGRGQNMLGRLLMTVREELKCK
jgi:ribA/ribD-fused uncharacterized protein